MNRDFYRKICLIGQQAGLNVFVFTPQGVSETDNVVKGYGFDAEARRWIGRNYARPDLVYDRCFFTSRRQAAEYREAVRRLRKPPAALFLGYGLRGKWDVQHMLERDGRFVSHLPQTEPMRSVRSAAEWLKRHGELVLKPQAGSQGRGVLHVRRGAAAARPGVGPVAPEGTANAEPAFAVRGRDARNRPVACSFDSAAALLRWLRRFTAQRDYLLQRYLPLHNQNGEAYDVRSLVQKDGTGRWQVTGIAVRKGQGGSLTSNLHGGGSAEPALPFLTAQFGAETAARIAAELERLSRLLPAALEQSHGRLAELGIDFGVDTGGHIWILEVNSKPGRSIFTYLHDDRARFNALANPIKYARYLLRNTRAGTPNLSLRPAPAAAKSHHGPPDHEALLMK
ncbi:YheC/YheD family protein [Paenibacillus doosanensis]|nr:MULTISPECIES: YheC/YheD family protein [Paenibacillus]MCS7463631.1 YheC/YheD family protein [Paenibacillus doosanensis]